MTSEMTLKPLPVLEVDEYPNPEAYLVAFYKSLGWDGLQSLDPCDYELSQQDLDQMYEVMLDMEYPRGGYLMMNNGPSGSPTVPKGFVLCKGES
jgi:hypothetical protein